MLVEQARGQYFLFKSPSKFAKMNTVKWAKLTESNISCEIYEQISTF